MNKATEQALKQPAPTVTSQSDIVTYPSISGPYKLYFKILSATLERDTDTFGKMDPYVVVTYTTAANKQIQKIKGPTHKGGAKAPSWNWEMELYLGGTTLPSGTNNEPDVLKDNVKFSIFEEDVTSSDLVGETADILLKSLIEGDKKTLKTHQINYQSKKAGQIQVEV